MSTYSYARTAGVGPNPEASLSSAGLAFLQKASKGLKGGLDLEGATEALALFGWRVQRLIEPKLLDGEQLTGKLRALGLLAPAARSYPPTPEFSGKAGHTLDCEFDSEKQHDLEGAERLAQSLRSLASGQATGGIGLGELALTDVSMGRTISTTTVFVKNAYLGVECLRVDTPRDHVVVWPKISDRGSPQSLKDTGSDRFWKFAYDHGLKALAKKALGNLGEEHVQSVPPPSDSRNVENVGTCSVCFNTQKLRVVRGQKLLALHGYERPGIGFIQGRCFGVDYPPYELSCEGTKAYLARIPDFIASTREGIKSLLARPEILWGVRFDGSTEELRRDAPTKRGVAVYERELKAQISRQQANLRGLEGEQKRLTKAVRDWKPRLLS